MMWLVRKLLKLDSPITVSDWFYQRIVGNWPWIAATFGSVGMAYLARLSDWMQPWGAVGWASVGLFFFALIGLTLATIYRLYAGALQRIQSSKTMKNMSENIKGVNPLRESFENEKVSISDFYTPIQTLYKRKTFRNCDFYGPGALLFFSRCNIDSPSIFRTDFIVIGEGYFASPIGFEDSSFYDCRFYGITLLMNAGMAQAIRVATKREGSQMPPFHGLPVTE